MGNSKQIDKKKLSIILLILLFLGLLTAAVLASRMGFFTKQDAKNYYDISNDTGGNTGSDVVSQTTEEQTANDTNAPGDERADGVVIVEEVKIFKVSYNETGEVTVKTCDGDKLIAPGTNWKYDFTVRNTETFSMDYTLRVEAFVTGTELTLPVLGRMKGPNGWMTAGEGEYVPVLELDGLSHNGVLAGGNTEDYKLSWKWPFESGVGSDLEAADAFDTMLGNLAVDEDLVLTIRFYIYAEADIDPEQPGGDKPYSPGTGDDFRIGFWLAAMIISLLVFIAVLAREKKERTAVQEALAYGVGERENKEE